MAITHTVMVETGRLTARSLYPRHERTKDSDVPHTTLPGANDAAWMAEKRAAALQALPALAMPSPTEENWRYIDLDFDPQFASAPSTPGPGDSDEITATWRGRVVRIVDGFILTDGVSTLGEGQDSADIVTDDDLFSTAFLAYASSTNSIVWAPISTASARIFAIGCARELWS